MIRKSTSIDDIEVDFAYNNNRHGIIFVNSNKICNFVVKSK